MLNPYEKPNSELETNKIIDCSKSIIWFKRASYIIAWLGFSHTLLGLALYFNFEVINRMQKYSEVPEFNELLALSIGLLTLVISLGLNRKPLIFFIPAIFVGIITALDTYYIIGIRSFNIYLSICSIIFITIALNKRRLILNSSNINCSG